MNALGKTPEEEFNEVLLALARLIARKLARQHHEEAMRLARERRGEGSVNDPGAEAEAPPAPTAGSAHFT